ncbi:hypothetical protein CF319_g6142 [Tilletia indica]|nr:hypothetical protein CF319_g6142 [Tilletia indica]
MASPTSFITTSPSVSPAKPLSTDNEPVLDTSTLEKDAAQPNSPNTPNVLTTACPSGSAAKPSSSDNEFVLDTSTPESSSAQPKKPKKRKKRFHREAGRVPFITPEWRNRDHSKDAKCNLYESIRWPYDRDFRSPPPYFRRRHRLRRRTAR